jgi:hypothetical protein
LSNICAQRKVLYRAWLHKNESAGKRERQDVKRVNGMGLNKNYTQAQPDWKFRVTGTGLKKHPTFFWLFCVGYDLLASED